MGWGGDMLEIDLFGRTRARVDGVDVGSLSGKQRQILAILALEAGTPVAKERLADQLWDGSPPGSYVGTLDSYICVLRRRLALGAGRGSLLATTQAGFMLVEDPSVVVDLSRFRSLARATSEATSQQVVELATQALSLVQGDLVMDAPYADWAVRVRESFRHELLELALDAAQRANAIGEPAVAERMARMAIRHDPVREDAWRQLMLAQWFSGRRAGALATYSELRSTLADSLGDEPGQESRELYLTVLRDEPDVPTEDHRTELRTLLRLLRQALDSTPGVRAPGRDSALSDVAMRALATAG